MQILTTFAFVFGIFNSALGSHSSGLQVFVELKSSHKGTWSPVSFDQASKGATCEFLLKVTQPSILQIVEVGRPGSVFQVTMRKLGTLADAQVTEQFTVRAAETPTIAKQRTESWSPGQTRRIPYYASASIIVGPKSTNQAVSFKLVSSLRGESYLFAAARLKKLRTFSKGRFTFVETALDHSTSQAACNFLNGQVATDEDFEHAPVPDKIQRYMKDLDIKKLRLGNFKVLDLKSEESMETPDSSEYPFLCLHDSKQ